MLFIIIAISGFILGFFLLFWALFAQSKQMTNDFHFDPDEYGLREHVEVKK
jgi:hypothetical protein